MSTSKLFQPISLGTIDLKHRIVMAPLTRFRADENHVPLPHVHEYYAQRASVPGTLIISEAVTITDTAGYQNIAGISSEEQIAAWKKVTDAVHAKGSFIYLQIAGAGRSAGVDPSSEYVGVSDIKLKDRSDGPAPRPYTVAEIKELVQIFAKAADNAVHKAGFDGVEVHGANGYLIDQFIQDVSNNRTDEYGGSVENRSRFPLEVIDAVSRVVGESRTSIRFSPWSPFQDMRMEDPVPQFSYLVTRLRELYPDLSYIHIVEPRVVGDTTLEKVPEGESNDFIREIWKGKRIISAGGYNRESAIEAADTNGDLVAFGRSFIANPDLPYRLFNDIPLTKGDRATYYRFGSTDPTGYTSYPFAPKDESREGERWGMSSRAISVI